VYNPAVRPTRLLVSLSLLLCSACARDLPVDRVLLISIDTLRPDYLGAYDKTSVHAVPTPWKGKGRPRAKIVHLRSAYTRMVERAAALDALFVRDPDSDPTRDTRLQRRLEALGYLR